MASAGGVSGWYSGKNIFITGGSGFVGVALLEKLLRSVPNLGDVYLLLRPKRGKEIEQRLEQIKKNSVFERLLEEKSVEQVFSRVKAVAGDIGSLGLGLSEADRRILTENVNVIFHSAATLDFTDGLKPTVQINLLGTRQMLELASQCRNLKAFLHVSSVYVNSYKLHAEEVIYPLNEDPERIIALVEKTSEKDLDEMTPKLLGDHPNTYTFTKHMAEHEVQKMQERFPCTIVRCSMITTAWKEPKPGWTVSKNGSQGFVMGASKGVVRRLPALTELIHDVIPIDIVVNQLIAAGFHAGVTQPKKVEIYQCSSSTRNPFRWSIVTDVMNDHLHQYPLKSAVWYPHLKFVPSIAYFKFSAIFLHFIPAFFLDLLIRVTGGKPILMKLHRNVANSVDLLEKFIFTEWTFPADRTMELQKWLSAEDQINYNIDIIDLSWRDHILDLIKGVRQYLSNERMGNLEAARRKDRLLMVLHGLLQAMILGFIWYITSCITGWNPINSFFIVPATYILLGLLKLP